MIDWLQKWYSNQCDGDWEHEYGIRIETIDNPGWIITIDLASTNFESLEIPYTRIENAENDWMDYGIKDKIFSGAGDSLKINDIINKFKEIVESK